MIFFQNPDANQLGSKKSANWLSGQVDFPSGQEAFHSHFPGGQGISQVVCQLHQ